MESIVEQCVYTDEQKIRVLKSKAEPQDFDCYKRAVKTFSKNCYNLGKVMITVLHFGRLTFYVEKRIILPRNSDNYRFMLKVTLLTYC